MIFSAAVVLLGILVSTSASGTGTSLDPCVPDDCGIGATSCVFDVKLVAVGNAVAYFEFDACPGIQQPTLGLKRDVTYRFNQYDSTNIMHPLGLAYYTDGAHNDVEELEPTIIPPGTTSSCDTNNGCPAPMYYQGETFQGNFVASGGGGDDFGLDAYEPFFKYPDFAWGGPDAGPKTIPAVSPSGVAVTAPLNWNMRITQTATDFDQDYFYFCHIHTGMSGRIKQLAADGTILSPNDFPALFPASLYPAPEYKIVSTGQEQICGTVGLNTFFEDTHNGKCPTSFICTEGLSFDTESANFNECLDAMDCAMQFNMIIVPNATDPIVTFVHSMVPHHINAIQMCKTLMQTGLEDDAFLALCWNIVNTQSLQIMEMNEYLASNSIPEGSAKCFDTPAAAIAGSPNNNSEPFSNQEPFFISITVFVAATFVVAVGSLYAARRYFEGNKEANVVGGKSVKMVDNNAL